MCAPVSYAVGSLVQARGREWVVLPESEENLLILRPLGGTEDEVAGVYLPLETVEPATFDFPDPTKRGDYQSSRLLRDAVRLGFRSFARIAVEPRPYQLVPLIMALRLDHVRVLISDDVGIGKTIEAALIAREAEALYGKPDAKLQKATKLIKELVDDGFNPIVFCRFIPTAEYVAGEFRKKLRGVEVAAVTGTLPPAEREERVRELGKHKKRVLVATDCLSEGINLQEHFDAVFHYDLSWNPTRHEQREGRVDR